MTRRLARLVAAAGCAALVGLSACADGDRAPSPTHTSSSPAVPTAQKAARASLIFGPDNAFRQDISKAPVARDSAALVKHLMSQITPNYGGQVTFNAHEFNSSMYVADAQTPTQTIAFDDCQDKGATPPGLLTGPKYFVNVPVPAGARQSEGTDGALTVWSPSRDQLWEFWVAKKGRTGRWSACWGGRIDHVSAARRGVFPAPFGASASGLATVGSMVTIEEARARQIEHAVQLAILYLKAGQAVYPANRSDGTDTDPAAIPMGTRLRLPRSVDVESLDLSPVGKAVARAAQTYGFLVTETSGAVAVGAESPNAAQAAGKGDPWRAILGDTQDWDVLKGFPWARLEVVQPGYGAPAGTDAVVTRW